MDHEALPLRVPEAPTAAPAPPLPVGAAHPPQALPGPFLAALGPSASPTPHPPQDTPPLFTEQQVNTVKEFLLDQVEFGGKTSDRLRAAAILAKSMFPALQSINPNINQPVTFVFQNIQVMAQEREQFEQNRKKLLREQRNIVNGVEQ